MPHCVPLCLKGNQFFAENDVIPMANGGLMNLCDGSGATVACLLVARCDLSARVCHRWGLGDASRRRDLICFSVLAIASLHHTFEHVNGFKWCIGIRVVCHWGTLP